MVEKEKFDFAKEYGVEPWVFYRDNNPALYEEAIENGAMLFTANDPEWVMDLLREKGLHE